MRRGGAVAERPIRVCTTDIRSTGGVARGVIEEASIDARWEGPARTKRCREAGQDISLAVYSLANAQTTALGGAVVSGKKPDQEI